ncbi:MAG: sulfatase-like hydrolase/transferase [Planctomycetota bacterium]|jgi:arylsulfatase A-like enzyme|nr:sulfatase-like hydrolase/transferase [Planctomycetota bacterium]
MFSIRILLFSTFSLNPVRAEAPNLLIIQTDEHNFRTLGCYRKHLPPEQALMWGKEVVETPNIDWLAVNGALCTSFYATTPVCSPSRAALMSGRYPHNTPVNTNNIALDGNVITFAEVLRRNGYATGYAGKWHLDGNGKPQWAPKRKFGFEDNRYMFNRGHWKQLEDTPNGPRVKARTDRGPNYGVDGADPKSFTTDFLCDKTIEFIETHRDKSFCYMVSLPDPHGPDTVRAPYNTMFSNQKYDQPRTFNVNLEAWPSWAQPNGRFNGMAAYYGMVKCIDDNLGKILVSLRKNGLIKKTWIVFTSDHGDLRGEHHRQNKGVPFEGSAKIAFLLYAPGKVRPGTLVHEALSCVDFMPTILPMMGFKPSGQEEGRDASLVFTAAPLSIEWNDIAFLRGTGTELGWLAAVTDRYKLVYATRDDPWLFDLKTDPDEMKNQFLNPDYRETVKTLSAQLKEYGEEYKDPRIANAKLKADLQWGIDGEGEFVPAKAPEGKKPRGKGKKRKKAK